MFALMPRQGGGGSAGAGSGYVLPRWLRRPARLVSRMCESDMPPFAATGASLALLVATGLYGAAVGGHMPGLLQGMTARSGFAVSDIRVTGNLETSEIDVVGALGLDGYTSLIGFDARKARDSVAALPWVESATIRKVYPDAIEVEIAERKAFAVWQNDGALTLVEQDGKPIAPLTNPRHAELPLVVGKGAAVQAAAFVSKVVNYPEVAGQVAGYIRVGERRWDLRLKNGITVRLPEGKEDLALAELVQLDGDNEIMSRDVVAIDLRLDDRIAVQLSPEAATARQEAMKKLLSGKKERRI